MHNGQALNSTEDSFHNISVEWAGSGGTQSRQNVDIRITNLGYI